MKIELPVRWTEEKKLSEEEQRLKKLLKDTDDNEEENDLNSGTFTYGKLTIDTQDIKSYNDFDEDHVILRTRGNIQESYCIGVSYDDFQRLLTEITGEAVFKVQKKVIKVTPKNKKNKKDDDDFLT